MAENGKIERDSQGKHWSTERLSDDDIARIREMAGRVPQREIAQMFGVSPGWVNQVINLKRRKGV